MVQSEVPGMLDACTLMHEGLAMDGGPEATQDEQAPGVKRLGSPATEKRPGVIPKQHSHPVIEGPGAVETACLSVSAHIVNRSAELALQN